MLLSLVRSNSSLKEELHVSLKLQGIPRSPPFKDKAYILSASLRNIPDENCCVLVSFQHDDARVFQAFSYSALGCFRIFWLRTVCWALVYSTHRSLPIRLVPVGRTSYCSDWATCKELWFTSYSLKDEIVRETCCAVDHSRKWMFPHFVVPILYFSSPGILPVLSVECYSPLIYSPLISFSPAREVFFLNLVRKTKSNLLNVLSPWAVHGVSVLTWLHIRH